MNKVSVDINLSGEEAELHELYLRYMRCMNIVIKILKDPHVGERAKNIIAEDYIKPLKGDYQ